MGGGGRKVQWGWVGSRQRLPPATKRREGCHFSSDERELGPGPGQGEENRPVVKMNTDVGWTDRGGSCLVFMREKGEEKETEREVKG